MKIPSRLLRLARRACSRLASSSSFLTRLGVGAASLLGCTSLAMAQGAAKAPVEAPVHVDWLQAIVLGLVQGLTEFIPVSSSAHLNITHHLLGQNTRQLTYDVVLSIGTIVALAWYFRHDWKALLFDSSQKGLRNLVFLSCVPAAIVGYFLRHLEDSSRFFTSPFYNGLWMILGGALLLVADRVGTKKRPISNLKNGDALMIGASQALALVPGFSRSGSTIAAGLLLGLQRADAARFSFLMSLPISIGAVLFELKGTIGEHKPLGAGPLEIVLGVVAAAVSGFWAIGFLLNFLRNRGVMPFFIWRLVVGLLAMILFWSLR